jgi:hypothetical protein
MNNTYTEEDIESIVEEMFDKLDRRLISHKITQEEYEAASIEIDNFSQKLTDEMKEKQNG